MTKDAAWHKDAYELIALQTYVKGLCQRINDWEVLYDQIFSEQISVRVKQLCHALDLQLDWVDPDTSYEADVKEFVNALSSLVVPTGDGHEWSGALAFQFLEHLVELHGTASDRSALAYLMQLYIHP